MADEQTRYVVSGVCCASEEVVLRKKLDAAIAAEEFEEAARLRDEIRKHEG